MGKLLHQERLAGVNDRLRTLVITAVACYDKDVTISEGVRTLAKQTAYYAQGRKSLEIVNSLRKQAGLPPIKESENKAVTATMKSKHLEGKAVDLVPIVQDKARYDLCKEFAPLVLAKAKELGISIRWGGDWNCNGIFYEKGETDSPHFEV